MNGRADGTAAGTAEPYSALCLTLLTNKQSSLEYVGAHCNTDGGYGTNMTEVCQKAAAWAAGLSTVTCN